MTWIKIFSAVMLGMMILVLWPRAKQMLHNSPKATRSDWQAVLLPLLGVVLFVMLLISLV